MTRGAELVLFLVGGAFAACERPREASPPTVTLPTPSTTSNPEPVAARQPDAFSNSSDASVDAQPGTRGTVTLLLVTKGAHVQLVSGKDRREVTTFPIRIRIDTSQSWTIEATKPGYRRYRQTIDFSDGLLDKTFDIELTP